MTSSSPQNNTGQGLFNFQDIMNKFMAWQPKEDDVAGQALKNTFQGNIVQQAFDTENTKDLAFTNQAIASAAMNQASQLELANQKDIMADEFDYTMAKMGEEFDLQGKFATDQANRDLNRLTHDGNIQGNLQKQTGEQAIAQLRQQGMNETDIQNLRNSGAIAQITAQGDVEKWMQTEKGKQALQQIEPLVLSGNEQEGLGQEVGRFPLSFDRLFGFVGLQ